VGKRDVITYNAATLPAFSDFVREDGSISPRRLNTPQWYSPKYLFIGHGPTKAPYTGMLEPLNISGLTRAQLVGDTQRIEQWRYLECYLGCFVDCLK
jgi:hypothetical protein